MKTYEAIDVSGDAGIEATGKTIEEAFANAARGMYGLITDTEKVNESRAINVEVESHSREGLLVSWLNELIFHFDAHGFIGREVTVESIAGNRLTAQVRGEEFDLKRHEQHLLVKAATYHQLNIAKRDDHWVVRVIFDI